MVYSRRAREVMVRVVVFVRVVRRWFMALDLFLGVRCVCVMADNG